MSGPWSGPAGSTSLLVATRIASRVGHSGKREFTPQKWQASGNQDFGVISVLCRKSLIIN